MKDRFRVIDAHCHVYPEKIAARAVAGTDAFYGPHALFSGRHRSKYDGTVATLLFEGEKAGVDHFLIQSVATTPRQVRGINEFIAKTVEAHPDRMTGLGTLHPDSEDLAGDLAHLLSLGLNGVKLHPDIQQFKIDDYRCLHIYELCEREGLPILMHTGDSRFDYSNPNRLLPVMQIYTGLVVVGAHLGGWSVWDEARKQLAGLPNLYVDCSSSFPFMPAEQAGEIIRAFGADRVLFGTDYPMFRADKELNTLFSLGFSDEELTAILSKNAEKVYRIPAGQNPKE